jgi:hypothetical protein
MVKVASLEVSMSFSAECMLNDRQSLVDISQLSWSIPIKSMAGQQGSLGHVARLVGWSAPTTPEHAMP